MRKLTFVIDIDGVLTEGSKEFFRNNRTTEGYRERTPNLANRETVNGLYRAGHRIIIHTARDRKQAGVKKATREWLKENEVMYHEIIFNKPLADVVVDDRSEKDFSFLEEA